MEGTWAPVDHRAGIWLRCHSRFRRIRRFRRRNMKGHKMRTLGLIVCAAALAAVIAASATARTDTIDRAGAGTLNIYGYGPGDDVQENRASYAASQLSGTTVNRPAGDFNDQVFLTQLASGAVPDLVRMSRS